MNNILKNNKGVVLIICYFVLVALLGLSAVIFVRSTNEARLVRRSADSLQAFYEAEAGISYAYYEARKLAGSWDWYTHDVNKNPVAFPDTTITQGDNPGDAYEEDHCYRIHGRDFLVKTYPDPNVAGVVVVLSQATVNGVTRTVEYRLGQESAYKYFFFYPTDHIFSSDTFDGRNYGAIHVNGDINLQGSPIFKYLTALTCAGPTDSTGYIRYPKNRGYPDLHGEIDYNSTVGDLTQLADYMYYYSQTQFYTGTTKFYIGDVDTNNHKDLNYLSGDDADWEWDKYDGNGTVTTAAHYNISNTDLKNLSTYEMVKGAGGISLLDNSGTIEIPGIGTGTEGEIFKELYNKPGDNVGLWNSFWEQWKSNHGDDYLAFHGTTLTGGADWERRFIRAAYNRADSNNDGIPDSYNKEWWKDLSYGDDRSGLTDDLAEARVESSSTGEPLKDTDLNYLYFLNTEEQPTAWETWLGNNNLNQEGDNQTLVQDRSQDAVYVEPGDIIPHKDPDADRIDQDAIKKDAKDAGVYIGLNDAETSFFNPINDCTEEKAFYNDQHPARNGTSYAPSNILQIDVKRLKEKIDNGQLTNCAGEPISKEDFNGIVYVDLPEDGDFLWSSYTCYDSRADGVMLVNGERLPDNGLSIVSPNNVYIKGNYNLDPYGDSQKNRTPDSYDITSKIMSERQAQTGEIDRYWIKTMPQWLLDLFGGVEGVIAFLEGLGIPVASESESLSWKPAETITTRVVYTLSEDFSEPQTMPLINHQYYQYYDQSNHKTNHGAYSEARVVDHPRWGTPGAGWMPTGYDWSSTITNWVNQTGTTPTWTTNWIESNWGTFSWSDPEVYSYNTDDADPVNDAYILRKDLKVDIYNKVYSLYNNGYNYDGSTPWTSSVYQKANPVTNKHIYNTAIVTPYSTSPYVLEYWGSKDRVINGAFIQLPQAHQEAIPPGSYESSRRYSNPSNKFNYETRFGRGAIAADRPAVGLTFGADSSWREISSASF